MENRSTNSTGQLTLEQQSLQALEKGMVSNTVTIIILSIMVAIGIVLLTVFYIGRKTFNTVHYQLLVQSYLGITLRSVSWICCTGIPWAVYGTMKKPCNTTVLICAFISVPFELTGGVEFFTLFMVALDRLLAVAIPAYYNTSLAKRKLYLYVMIFVPWICMVLELVAKFAASTKEFLNQEIPICGGTRPSEIETYKKVRSNSLAAATVLCFIAAVVVIKYRIYKTPTQQVKETKQNLGYRVVITSVIDGTVFCCSDFAKSIYIVVIGYFKTSQSSPLTFITPSFILIGVAGRLIIMLIRNETFRGIVLTNILKTGTSTTSSVRPVK